LVRQKYGKAFPSPVRFSELQPYPDAIAQSMVQGTMAFFNLATATLTEPTVGLLFTAGLGGPLPPALVPQVGIVRVQ